MKRKVSQYETFTILLTFLMIALKTGAQEEEKFYRELYRPQIHFSPKEKWMNDPNGMVYYKGVYHLFFQYYPGATVWGPMYWGHAISKDLVHWVQLPVALSPDSLGYIFSGSVVADTTNSSGFGSAANPPLVAIYTNHDVVGERAKKNNFQNQSIAYSTDGGMTWAKYEHNPVIANPGITDFRDPKVSWYAPGKKWIMTLATKDRVTFYSSGNLKTWSKESEFGAMNGSHAGVWECPDLLQMEYMGKQVWVLLVSINPGAPNGGSGTQYFTGDFDGHHFLLSDTVTKWLDHGMDNYAGVTWSNTGTRKIFLGWMSNWGYAQSIPTTRWRGTNTLPRELGVVRIDSVCYLKSEPVRELQLLVTGKAVKKNIKSSIYSYKINKNSPFRMDFKSSKAASFKIVFSNSKGDKAIVGYDMTENSFYIDRTNSGTCQFSKDFPGRHKAKRLATSSQIGVTVYADASSIELFADNGLSVFTDLVFPSAPYTDIAVFSKGGVVNCFAITRMRSIWE